MEKIQAVIFDVYKTLLDIEVDEECPDTYVFLSQWLSYHGIEISPLDLSRQYKKLCQEEISKNTEFYPDIEIREVFFRMVSDCERYRSNANCNVGELALLFRILTTQALSMYPGVPSMLNALQGKVRMGIVSNSQRLFTIPELTKFRIAQFFDVVVFSSDVGTCKPNPKIFKSLLDSMSIPPEAAVFVGDNIVGDIYGAKRIGMKTVWINHGYLHANLGMTEAIQPDYEIQDESYDYLTEIILSLL